MEVNYRMFLTVTAPKLDINITLYTGSFTDGIEGCGSSEARKLRTWGNLLSLPDTLGFSGIVEFISKVFIEMLCWSAGDTWVLLLRSQRCQENRTEHSVLCCD